MAFSSYYRYNIMLYVKQSLDHLSVSEKLTNEPWTEVRLYGKMELSKPAEHSKLPPQILESLVDGFSTALREWLDE